MTRSARDLGATRLIGIITTQWPIWAKRLGLDIHAIGRPLHFDEGDSQAVSINLAGKLH